MEHTVDDTAKAILRDEIYDPDDILRLYTGDGAKFLTVEHGHLQAMATFWLMKRECMSALHFAIDIAPNGSTVKENATEWLAQIEALEK